MADDDTSSETRARDYWRANLRLLAILLAVWAFVGWGLSIVFVDALDRISLFGFPLGFWFAQQGAILVFVVLIFVYAAAMKRIDRAHGASEE